jgi:Flp pilus assembly protein protease CpaA
MWLALVLLLLTILVSIHDYRHRKIPNWVNGPLLLAGLVAHAPGTPSVVISSLLLLSFWFFFRGRGVGAGDVKLWLALLWAFPPSVGDQGSLVMFTVIAVTGGLQILNRKWRSPDTIHIATPAAWRTTVFMSLIVLLSMMRYV